jgi:DNA-binding response OmpR family regulator
MAAPTTESDAPVVGAVGPAGNFTGECTETYAEAHPNSATLGRHGSVEWGTRWVRKGDVTVHLSSKPAAIFRLLADHAGQVVPYHQISQAVWIANGETVTENTLQVNVSILRRAIQPLGMRVGVVRNKGYRLIWPAQAAQGVGE